MRPLRLFLAGSVVLALPIPSFAQKIYFTDGTPHTIRRANLDGSNVEDVVDTSPTGPYSIAVDRTHGLIFWTVGSGNVFRASLAGTNVAKIVNQVDPRGIAVDPGNERIYWAFGFDFVFGTRRADLDGSNVETIYDPPSYEVPERLAIAPTQRKLYWTECSADRIRRSNMDGTEPETMILTSSELNPWAIAVDSLHGTVFWTEIDFSSGLLPGKIRRANLDGTQIEDIGALAPGAYGEVAVDPYSATLYWSDSYKIRRANLDGSNAEDLLTTGLEFAGPITTDVGAAVPALSIEGVAAFALGILVVGVILIKRNQALVHRARRMVAIGVVPVVLACGEGAIADWEDDPGIPLAIGTCSVDSGLLYTPESGGDPVVLFDTVVNCRPGVPWMRLHFSVVHLGVSAPSGNGSFLRLTSLADNAYQILNSVSISEWSNTSAYFTGDSVHLELIAYPNTGTYHVVVDKLEYPVAQPTVCAPIGTPICGPTDDRVPSADPRAARYRFPRNCLADSEELWFSAFLVSQGANWFLTVGHGCKLMPPGCDFSAVVEFDVPTSQPAPGILMPAAPERQFPISFSSVQWQDNAAGDWCFFATHRNSNPAANGTRLTPVQTQGASFRIPSTLPPANSSTLRVTGFGVDDAPTAHCGTLQSATGPYLELNGTTVKLGVDAENRNSGSVVESICGSAYAILTDGTCLASGGNLGTAITYGPLQDALTPNSIDFGTKQPLGAAADCNGNGITDWIEVQSPTVPNCNNNLIPDDCESYANCNENTGNTVRDICEVGSGAAPDCNGNGVPDSCDLTSGFSQDCNCNTIPDECDICADPGADANNNWILDWCEGGSHGVVEEPGGIHKNRFLSFSNPASVGPTAIRVTMVDLQHPLPANRAGNPPQDFTTFDTTENGLCVDGSHAGHHCDGYADCRVCVGGPYERRPCVDDNQCCTMVENQCTGQPGFCPTGTCSNDARKGCRTSADCVESAACTTATFACSPLQGCTAAGEGGGCTRWVGPVGTYPEKTGTSGLGSYKAARLQCTPYYSDAWYTQGVFHVTGTEIMPSSTYDVQVFAASCAGTESTCASVSCPVTLGTARWSDVIEPWESVTAQDQPYGSDVVAIVDKFRGVPGSPSQVYAKLQPNLPDLLSDIGAIDIMNGMDAFKGLIYPFSGPCPCPSAESCTQQCENPGNCNGGVCVTTCMGGTKIGEPCLFDDNCPGSMCGTTRYCRDQCGRCTP